MFIIICKCCFSILKKRVANHPNIIQFVSAAGEEIENARTKEFLILTELCKGFNLMNEIFLQYAFINWLLILWPDPLIDHVRVGLTSPSGKAFNFEQVLRIFYQICNSVRYLHSQEPQIIHRDLKVLYNQLILHFFHKISKSLK